MDLEARAPPERREHGGGVVVVGSKHDDEAENDGKPRLRLVTPARKSTATGSHQADADVVAPFPLEVLPERLQQFAGEGAAAMACPPDFFGVSMVVTMAAAIGASREIELKPGWREPPIIYAALVGDTGSGKTPAVSKTLAPVYAKQEFLAEQWKAAKERWRAERAETGKASQAPPSLERLIVSDSTTEALAQILLENARGVLLGRDEITAFVRGMDQYRSGKGTDREFWLSAWSRTPITVDRKADRERGPIFISRPHVCIIGGVPPDMLDELSDQRAREDGLLHRILSSFPDPCAAREWSEASISDEATAAWADALAALRSLRMPNKWTDEPGCVRFTRTGRAAWVRHYNAHQAELRDPSFPPNLRGVWKKLETYAGRFALILQLSRVACRLTEKETVTEATVHRAWKLVAYFKSHARRVYRRLSVSPQDKADQQALAWIRRQSGRVSAREVQHNHVAGVRTSDEAKALLRRLASRGFGEITENEKKKTVHLQLKI